MKSVKLSFLALLFSILLSGTSEAQVSALIEGGMIQFTQTENQTTQLGLQLSGKYSLNDNFRMGANLGYYFRSHSHPLLGNYHEYTMPVSLLAEYILIKHDFSPYVGLQGGMYRMGTAGDHASSMVYTGFAPLVGFDYNLSESLRLTANFRYHFIFSELDTSTRALGVNAGIILDF
ncbi:MAG: outer membrane beta-barrel protein [Bacteroidales bacterium]